MIVHNVYFWLNEDVTESEKNNFEKGIKSFLDAVDRVQMYEIGTPAKTPDREVVDHSFAYSMFVWFNTVGDHNAYQKHEAHDVFINSFKALCAKVQVLDYEAN